MPNEEWDVIYRNENGIQLPDGSVVKTVYVEMKNKHNTMNSASAGKTFIKMQNQILLDDDCACFLVEAIAQKSQNIKWETTVDKQRVGHKLIRRVSLDQFYALVTGEEDAFYQMCMILPEVIQKAVDTMDNVEIPQDTVIDELRNLSTEYDKKNSNLVFLASMLKEDMTEYTVGNEEVSLAMAVYILGFGGYKGF